MGINPRLFQREKRVRFRVQGTLTLETGDVFIVLVYNNRGLQIVGKEISVQYL